MEDTFGWEVWDAQYSFSNFFPYLECLAHNIVNDFKPLRVLDLGCAKGFLVYALRKLGVEAFGLDISPYALSCCPQQIRPYVSVADLSRDPFPFEKDYFDFVSCLQTIDYLQTPEHLINEVGRTCRPGGYVFVKCTNPNNTKLSENLRVSRQSKTSWINKFAPAGFEYVKGPSKRYLVHDLNCETNMPHRRKSWRLRFGSLLASTLFRPLVETYLEKLYFIMVFVKSRQFSIVDANSQLLSMRV